MIVVVMGVAGSGKSTVGAALAQRLNARFVDADGLHAPESVERMRRGIALDDVHREPWLRQLEALLAEAAAQQADLVVAASALKRAYRDRFREAAPGVRFVHLDGPPDCLRARIGSRAGHFMPAILLESQLASLEPPAPDEEILQLDVRRSVPELVEQAAGGLR